MALGTGMGAEMMQPMAVVTIGGLSYATLMTLFVVPVLYDLFNGEKLKAREIEMMKEAAGMQREGFDGAPALPENRVAAKPEAQAPDMPTRAEAEAQKRLASEVAAPDAPTRAEAEADETPEPPKKSQRVKVRF